MTEEQRLKEILEYIEKEYSERRSDVSEIAELALAGDTVEDIRTKITPEHRYIKFMFRGNLFIYDTLTTLVETNGKPFSKEKMGNRDCEYSTLVCSYIGD